MSRVANKPIPVPSSVNVKISDEAITISNIRYGIPKGVQPVFENGVITFKYEQKNKCQAGTLAALVRNGVKNLSGSPYQIKLLLIGVGYRAQIQGTKLVLTLGKSHPDEFPINEFPGVKFEVPTQTEILISGTDKQLVGEIAARIRRKRSPDAYKGKGIRLSTETIILKETKKK